MRIHSRIVIGPMVGLGFLMIGIVGLHLGGRACSKSVSILNSSVLSSGGSSFSFLPTRLGCQERLPHSGRSANSWAGPSIGCGCIMWGIGEGFWRYSFALGQNPFPSLADIGYASFPPLVLLGLLLSFSRIGSQRLLVLLDSLIAMGSFLAIAWYLLLGSLAQTSGETTLAKFLGLYYPTADVALLSCVLFFLLYRQESVFHTPARRVSLLVLGCGLSLVVLWIFSQRGVSSTTLELTSMGPGWTWAGLWG